MHKIETWHSTWMIAQLTHISARPVAHHHQQATIVRSLPACMTAMFLPVGCHLTSKRRSMSVLPAAPLVTPFSATCNRKDEAASPRAA